MIEELPLASWTGPHDAALKARAVTALESGAVLYFPHLPFVLRDDEKEFLDAKVADGKAKNISLDHTSGKMQASSLTGDKAVRLAAMIERFGAGAAQLVQELLPYRTVERARYWRTHHNQPLANWMSVNYIAHSYRVPPPVLYDALKLEPIPRDRRPLAQIAKLQKRSIEEVKKDLEDAIEKFRAENPPPETGGNS